MDEQKSKTTKTKKKKTKEITIKASKNGRHYMGWLNFYRVLVLPFYYLLKPFKYYGEKKPPEGGCVLVCNHYTMLDIVYPAATTWEGMHFVGKRSLDNVVVMKPILRSIRYIPVNRDGSDVRALLDCFKCLKNGEKICVFPEGTRNKTQADMLPFKHGASMMAIKTKSPILPMVLYTKPRWFRKTHVIVGEPFEFTEYYDKKKLTEEDFVEADNKLRDKMLALREEHRLYLETEKNRKKKKKEKQ